MKFELLSSLAFLPTLLFAHDFRAWNKAVPGHINVESIAPVFDMDTDGCLPAAAISRSGQQNGGLKTTGTVGGACRSKNFLSLSNTYHRHTCKRSGGHEYCAHMYVLYFEKDQMFNGSGGHRHDFEEVVVWTRNGAITHGSYSRHGKLVTKEAKHIPKEGNHLKVVYHKEGIFSHALRFAGSGERAENPYGRFVTPNIISWYEAHSEKLSNAEYRHLMNKFSFGKANLEIKDSNFLKKVNGNKPKGYPKF
eukprot:maker-scaffold_20-snap-gene-2.8-mRNA-1 protein AED:0.02 eAED:0.03 QI:0/0/0/1/1/1/2/0/249